MEKGLYLTHETIPQEPTNVPVGCIFKPFECMNVAYQPNLQECPVCQFYCNMYCEFNHESRVWKCATCGRWNPMTPDHDYNLIAKTNVLENERTQNEKFAEHVIFVLTGLVQPALPAIVSAASNAPPDTMFLLYWLRPENIQMLICDPNTRWSAIDHHRGHRPTWISKNGFMAAAAKITEEAPAEPTQITKLSLAMEIVRNIADRMCPCPIHTVLFLNDWLDSIEPNLEIVSTYLWSSNAFEHMVEHFCFSPANHALSVVSNRNDHRMVRMFRKVSVRSGGSYFENASDLTGFKKHPAVVRNVQITVMSHNINPVMGYDSRIIRRARASEEMVAPIVLFNSIGHDMDDGCIQTLKRTYGMLQFITRYTDIDGIIHSQIYTKRLTFTRISTETFVAAVLLWHLFLEQLNDETDTEIQQMIQNHMKTYKPPKVSLNYSIHRQVLHDFLFSSSKNEKRQFYFQKHSFNK